MRKFLFSTSVLGVLFNGIAVAKTTTQGPRDWRLILLWVSWAAALAIAIGNVVENTKDAEDY